MKKGAKLEDRVIAYLRRAAEVRGKGVLERGQLAAGFSKTYIRSISPSRFGIGRVRAIVEGCDMDPLEILRYALDTGPVARFVADGRRLAPYMKDFPKAVEHTVCRMRAKFAEQDGGGDLEAIDALRYRDPRAALQAIEGALRVVSGPKTYARALGIWGSAQAGVYRLDYATMGIGLAIEAAQAASDSELLAVLLQRAAYSLRDRGELDRALEVGNAMLELRVSQGESEGMGRAFVVLGSLLRSAGDPAGSVRCSRAGLEFLAPASQDWRFIAYQSLSVAFATQGDLDAADRAAQSAQQLGISSPSLLGHLSWSRARMVRQRGELAQAARFYREALRRLASQVIDAGLVGAELVRVLLEADRIREAQGLASSLSGIADAVSEHPLDFDQAISAAILDLALAGLEAKASVALASCVVQAIERGQATATARLRRDLRL